MDLFSSYYWWHYENYRKSLGELYGGGCPPKTYGMAIQGKRKKKKKKGR